MRHWPSQAGLGGRSSASEHRKYDSPLKYYSMEVENTENCIEHRKSEVALQEQINPARPQLGETYQIKVF